MATAITNGRVMSYAGEKAAHPKGLYVLFATEMWERFSFYTMLALLTLYMKNTQQGLGWTAAKAISVYSNYMMFVYASPLIGGWIADRFTGYRKAVTIGAFFFAAGHISLAFHSVTMLYVALVLLVIGNGFFKPNISTIVGNLYPEGSPLKDSAYNIFYMGINIGAFLAPVLAEIIMQRYGFHPAFAVAGFGMFISLAIFWGFQKHLRGAIERRRQSNDKEKCEQNAVSEDIPPTCVGNGNALGSVPDWQRIMALFVIFGIVIVFWMVFHQSFSTLTYWADENTDWTLAPVLLQLASILTLGTVKADLGNVSGVISNAINPFWVITLTFPLVAFWRWLARRGKEPSTPTKMAFGMFLTAASFYVLYFAAISGGDTGKVSPWWLIAAYAVLTSGELMLSPMGLSLVSKVAPTRIRGFMMGGWFLATAIGNKLTAIGVYWEVWKHSSFFAILATMALGMGILLLLLLKPLKKAMPGV